MQLADEKLYEHWRSNCPDLREVESRKIQKHVVNEWAGQKERRKQVNTNTELTIYVYVYVHDEVCMHYE